VSLLAVVAGVSESDLRKGGRKMSDGLNEAEAINEQIEIELYSLLEELNRDQLRALNKEVVKRLKEFRRKENLVLAAKFSPGDYVTFEYKGRDVYGFVVRVNQTSLSIKEDDNPRMKWRVWPGHCSHV
jgi:hypothetical protein